MVYGLWFVVCACLQPSFPCAIRQGRGSSQGSPRGPPEGYIYMVGVDSRGIYIRVYISG